MRRIVWAIRYRLFSILWSVRERNWNNTRQKKKAFRKEWKKYIAKKEKRK